MSNRIYHHHHGVPQLGVNLSSVSAEKERKEQGAEGSSTHNASRPWNRDACAAIRILSITYLSACGVLPGWFTRERVCG